MKNPCFNLDVLRATNARLAYSRRGRLFGNRIRENPPSGSDSLATVNGCFPAGSLAKVYTTWASGLTVIRPTLPPRIMVALRLKETTTDLLVLGTLYRNWKDEKQFGPLIARNEWRYLMAISKLSMHHAGLLPQSIVEDTPNPAVENPSYPTASNARPINAGHLHAI